MRENNVGAKADLGMENQQVNPNRTINESCKSYKKSSTIEKISECENTGLPTRTAEPAPGYN